MSTKACLGYIGRQLVCIVVVLYKIRGLYVTIRKSIRYSTSSHHRHLLLSAGVIILVPFVNWQ